MTTKTSLLDNSFGPFGKPVTIVLVVHGKHFDKLQSLVSKEHGDTLTLNEDGEAVLQYTRKRMDAGSWNCDETILYELAIEMQVFDIPDGDWRVDWAMSTGH